jgi:hypothetical protein
MSGAARPACARAVKHGYEVMTNLPAPLVNERAIIRVISSMLRRFIEGLTVAI